MASLTVIVVALSSCGGGAGAEQASVPSRTTTNTTAAATTTIVTTTVEVPIAPAATSTTAAVATTTTATTAPPPLTTTDVVGTWNRESSEHGSEFLRMTDGLEFAYADGELANLDRVGALGGSFDLTAGVFTVSTADCPGVAGTYTLRLFTISGTPYLQFTPTDDPCEGRREGLTFDVWAKQGP